MAAILVTGAAGFIGSHTVDRLLATGYDVVGVDNYRTGKRENLALAATKPGFRMEELDCTDQAAMIDVMARVQPEAVIHLAALVSVQESIENPELNFVLNVGAAHNVAIAAQAAGVPRLVYSSSAAVYGHQKHLPISEKAAKAPISPYGAAKLAAEGLLRGYGTSYGMTVVCLRYFNVFGPRQNPSSFYSGVISIFGECFRQGKPVTVYGSGRQTRDFVSVHDVSRANLLAAVGRVDRSCSQNICTGKRTSVLDLVVSYERLYPDHPPPIFAEERAGDIWESCGDPSRAKKTLMFNAEVDVGTGLRELIRGIPITDRSLDPRPDLTL
jgi:UDP-glucose 4-epimerase